MKNPANLLYTILICLISTQVYSQGKEANIWYFGAYAGVDFNQGSPPGVLHDSQMVNNGFAGCASIADSLGNLLFYSDGVTIWNKNHVPMLNGQNMGQWSSQGAMIVPLPSNNHLYYFFNYVWDNPAFQYHFQYSIIDMDLNNGNGAVISDKKGIRLFDNSSHHLSAVKHVNGKDVWVVSHGYHNDRYYAFLLTATGLNEIPVISYSGSIVHSSDGYMKISPNGKRVGLCTTSGAYPGYFESINFDNETGVVSDENMVRKEYPSYGIEYSPDNSKLYISTDHVFQYDLNAGTPQEILASETDLWTGSGSSNGGALQLGPDGKIYCTVAGSGSEHYLSVIHNPNTTGIFCNFERDALYLEGSITNQGLPSFIQSYLNDPTFTAQDFCLGDATTFEVDDVNGIDSVYWKFNDFPNMPNDTSTQFSPEYVFSHADTYQVDLTVYSGLLEKTVSREVIINPVPEPNLGNDTLFCDLNFSLTLHANCTADSYQWNDFSFGEQKTVSDTGTYWVRATLNGCAQVDSIYVGLYPAPTLDETTLQINAAGCGLPTGSIAGLVVLGTTPFDYYWVDMAGDTVGINLDLSAQYAGSYTLKVVDGHGCGHELSTFIIPDNGTLVVDSVQFTPEHCHQAQATLTIFTDAPTPDTFEYSIDGVNFFQNQGLFSGISAGTYHITIKDANGCVGVYDQNPVVIDNISGPQVPSVDIIPEDNNLGNGSINIHAIGGSGDLTYSIDNGSPVVQLNDGLFNNLTAGNYLCSVTDAFGCDTTFTVYVPLVITQTLEAIAGFGSSCVEDAVLVPLELVNFTGVKSFVVTLHYEPNIVMCDGYVELNPQLELGDFQATVQQAIGEIKLNWQGQVPVTLANQAQMLRLKYDGLGEGISPINWEAAPGESHFYDENLQEISAAYTTGEIQVFSQPEIQMQSTESVCVGDALTIEPIITGGNGEKNYIWSGPNGFSSGDTLLNFDPVTTSQAGSYTLSIEDAMKCKKSTAVELIVMESPTIAFSGYDTLFVEPGYLLDAGHDAQHYLWNTGATTEQIAIDTTGLYGVEATSGQGCKNSDAVYILWAGKSFYIPNAFTPNGDGLNDVFGAIPRIDYVNQYRISIFNRWGQLLFESSDLHLGWDGTYQGEACPAGAYVYRIVYNDFGMGAQETKVMEGTVVLVR